jgi:hypothetical protein
VRLTLAIAAALFTLTACGGGGDSSTPTPDFATVSRDAADDIPLTPEDLNGDWEILPGDETDFTGDLALSPECNIFDLGVVFPDAAATSTGDTLTGGLQQQLTTFGAVHADPAAAQEAIDRTAVIVEACGDEFETEVRRIANEQIEALGIDLGIFADIDVGISPTEPPVDAEGSAAYRVGVTIGLIGGDQRFTLDVFLLREGRAIGAATYAAFGLPNTDEEATIAAALHEQVTEAEAQLPASPSPTES